MQYNSIMEAGLLTKQSNESKKKINFPLSNYML